MKHRIAKSTAMAGIFVALLLASIINVPQLLAFPYQAQYGSSTVYSEQPIGPEIKRVMAKADALTQASAIYAAEGYATDIFLTDGVWRWPLLAMQSRGAFAITRPLSNAIVINRSDIAQNKVWNGMPVGGERSLSAIIAHERTHGLIRHSYGQVNAAMLPSIKVEGYCDYVSQESSLTPALYASLKQAGNRHPAIPYYEGRLAAENALEKQHLSVDQFLIP